MAGTETKIERSYNQEDIQQILQLAIARQAYTGEFTRAQLLEIAAELEIPAECLQLAEQEWLSQQGELQKRQAFNSYRWSKLQKHSGNYLIVNTFLASLNLLGSGQLSWSLYVALAWGLGLGLQAWNTWYSSGEDYEREFQKWHRKYQLRQAVNNFFARFVQN